MGKLVVICFENIEPLIIKYEGEHLFIINKLLDHLFKINLWAKSFWELFKGWTVRGQSLIFN